MVTIVVQPGGMAMMWRTVLLVAAGFLVAADSSKDDAAKKDQDKFQGTWKVQNARLNGKDVPPGLLARWRVVIAGDKVTIQNGMRDQSFTIVLDPSQKPAAIDFDGKAKGIYQLKGNFLKLCWAKAGNDRPTKFASKPGSDTVLLLLKRVKK
jgi:uncharacterized protein (TIGR03067 family)